ncbi:hypothetical protein SR1949_20280 [Sphaerospermopsis reniformis]|uniref:O-antigen polymerase n=1 Tax=Sphaerospermopsis reniformis TaxID=531300 RepID=A0A479ZXJ7_9CYAN|nr:oligosaccharide repeat unit polymerase [Sphaerospermopsis reniformis]GCL36922.1 hypothetical protein SR1949_20280 [Sphaerospermopsis reniformis]
MENVASKIRIKSEIFKVIILYIIYFACLLWVYSSYFVITYGYQGFRDSLNLSNLPLSVSILSLLTFFAGTQKKPSVVFLHFSLLFIVTPSLTLFCGADVQSDFIFVTVSAHCLLSASTYIPIPKLKLPNISSQKMQTYLLLLSVLLIASMLLFGGSRYLNFDLTKVYDFRREAAANLPAIYAYLSPNLGQIIIPTGISIAILNKRWQAVFTLMVCAIFIFGLTSHKGPLFYPLLVILIYLFSQRQRFFTYLVLLLILIVLLSGVDLLLLQQASGENILSGWFSSLAMQRTIMVPAYLNWAYFDFFSDTNKYYYWSDSILSLGMLSSPYDLSIPYLIGYYYAGGSHANTGWIGSGYAQAGLIGVYLYSILMGLCFSYLNSMGKKIGNSLVISIFAIPALTMITSADLPTMLLTHGLLIALILVTILKKDNYRKALGTDRLSNCQ